ncbi:MAG: inner membrane protein YpjD [Steroidobacteraceae bacterium]
MLAIIVFVIYFCACLWLFASAHSATNETGAHGKRLAGVAMGILGWLIHGYELCRAVFSGPTLALDSADTASLIGWIIAAITLIKAWNQPRFAAIAGMLLLGAGISAALTDDGTRIFSTSQPGWELTAHILIAVVAYALIAVGASLALGLYILDRRLRSHKPLGWMKTLPSIEGLENGMFQAITVGFALLTLTLFSGFVFVRDLLAQHLVHKAALSCVAWLILGILLWGHWRLGWRGRTAAQWALGGFVLLGLAYFGTKFVLEVLLGRHWG